MIFCCCCFLRYDCIAINFPWPLILNYTWNLVLKSLLIPISLLTIRFYAYVLLSSSKILHKWIEIIKCKKTIRDWDKINTLRSYKLTKAFLSLLAILWNSAFKWAYLSFSPLLFTSLLLQLFVRPPQTTILLFCISFPWEYSWSLSSVQCHKPPSIVHQALYQIKSLKSVSHFHCIIIRDLI